MASMTSGAGTGRALPALVLGILLAAAPHGAAALQQASYTASQATEGAEVYRTACAVCHLENMQGSDEAPQLAGRDFRGFRGNQPAVELVRYLRATMPPGAEGSLSDEEYAAVTAYLMQENGVAAGGDALTLESSGALVLGGGDVVAASGRRGRARPPTG